MSYDCYAADYEPSYKRDHVWRKVPVAAGEHPLKRCTQCTETRHTGAAPAPIRRPRATARPAARRPTRKAKRSGMSVSAMAGFLAAGSVVVYQVGVVRGWWP